MPKSFWKEMNTMSELMDRESFALLWLYKTLLHILDGPEDAYWYAFTEFVKAAADDGRVTKEQVRGWRDQALKLREVAVQATEERMKGSS